MTNSGKELNIWIIPSFYPTEDHPLKGIFFKEQAEAISKIVGSLTVIYPESRSLKEFSISKLKKYYFQKTINYENNILTYRKHNWNLFRLQFDSIIGHRLWTCEAIRMADDLFNKGNRPDLIHAQCCISAGKVALELKKKYGIPYVITEHTTGFITHDLSKRMKRLVKNVFDESNQGIVVSNPFREILYRKVEINTNVIVIPNFIDSSFFLSIPNKSNEFTFTTICQLENKKRIDRLLYAFSEILAVEPNVKLIIGGTGTQKSKLVELSSSLGISKSVNFIGQIDRLEVRDILNRSHCFILPSDTETFGVVLIEALFCGLPIIATKSGGPEDIIDKDNGYLVDKSEYEIFDAMLSMIKNYDKFDSDKIRNNAVSKFSNSAVSSMYKNLYYSIIRSND